MRGCSERRSILFAHGLHCFHSDVRNTYGPFEYLNASHFPNFDAAMGDFGKWKRRLEKQVERSLDPKGKEDFVVSYFRDYGDQHDKLPVWMMVELLDFGGTLYFFRGVKADLRKTIADPLGQPEEVVLSWLVALNIVRNRCAHHARLWNWGTGNFITECVVYPLAIANPYFAKIIGVCQDFAKLAGCPPARPKAAPR